MSKAIIAAIAGVAVLVVGGITYAVGNVVGTPTLATSGVITDIDHRPRHTCGTKKDSHGKSVTKWCDAEWKVEVRYLGVVDRRTTGIRPPSWQREGLPVRAYYNVGRWDKHPHLSRIAPR